MSTPVRLGLFALGLVAVFAAALGVGRLAGPSSLAGAPQTEVGGHGSDAHGETGAGDGRGGTGDGRGETAAEIPGGLQVAQDGYRLEVLTDALSTGEPQDFRFRIIGPQRTPVTSYVRNHDKDLHMIVVRRDLTHYAHVHPTLGGDGVWSIPLRVGAAGQYRVLADFQPAGRDEPLTLGIDVAAAGDYRPVALPAASKVAEVDGYRVVMTGELSTGTQAKLVFEVSRNGRPVSDLEPYLGAAGHLVVLRAGDLAYLHVHPEGELVFHAEIPSDGRYRLFLDFKHGGVVRTAEFGS